jgi:hypothetical protein
MALSTEEIKNILQSLGYKLTDNGKSWRAAALYRDGDNPNALRIYKNSGVFSDFVEGVQGQPFIKLIERHKNENPELYENLKKDYQVGDVEVISYQDDEDSKITMNKIWPDSVLRYLFPNTAFYNQEKGITDQTLSIFGGGLAQKGKLYQRYVFPVRNEHGQLCGFSGRSVIKDANVPPWKNIGDKRTWIYPYYTVKSIREAIDDSQEVIVVESIGDALNLYQNGVYNVIVSFGTAVLPKILGFLASRRLKKITLAFNNDFQTKDNRNRGLEGIYKAYFKLMNHIDLDRLLVKLPSQNDFGLMNSAEIAAWKDIDVTAEETKELITNGVRNLINRGIIKSENAKKQAWRKIKILDND